MRQIVILISIILTCYFLLYNFYQLRTVKQYVRAINEVTELQKKHSNDRFIAQRFYISLVEKQQKPGLAFESFNTSQFFSSDDQLLKSSVYREWKHWQKLVDTQYIYDQQKSTFNRLVFDSADYDSSLELVADWINNTNQVMGSLQTLLAELVKYFTARMEDELAKILPVDLIVIVSVLSLWFWLGYQKQKKHLESTIALNKDLENKKHSLLASQKVMVSIFDDMKQERTRALELADDNQQLAAIVQQANDAIFRLTLDGEIISYNKATEINFDIDSETLPGLHFKSLFSDDCERSIIGAIQEAVHHQQVPTIHIKPRAEYALSENLTYEATFSLLQDAKLKETGVAVIVRDISYQYQEIEQLRAIIYQAPNALIMVNENGQIIMSNALAESMFGYGPGGLLGEQVEVLVPSTVQDHHVEYRAAYLKAPLAKRMGEGRDLTAKRKDGTELPVEIGLSPVSAKNKNYTIVSITDISERLRHQESLNQINQQLTAKNHEMEQFIYTVSHDLRSPLVTIEAFARKLAKELEGQLTDKQMHRLKRIQHNVGHMEQLLLDLLNLSRIIQKKIEKHQVDLDRCVKKVLSALEVEIDQVKATINIEQPLLPVYANESMLHQCLQNLIVNSVKYRDADRPLEITISTYQSDSGVAISINDNGLGIEPRYQEQIFRIFERLDQGEGTGVGLAIVKTIMDKHDGEVFVDSTPKVGSTFTLVFPEDD